jgi:hypothetical protein
MRPELAFLLMTPILASGQPAGPAPVPGYLCPPRLQVRHPELCPDAGPGAALLSLAQEGLYPTMPLPTAPLDPHLFYVPTEYLRARNKRVQLYATPEDALKGSGETGEIQKGFVFFRYSTKIPAGGDRAAYATSGGYVSSSDVAEYKPPLFHGEAFARTPQRPFGWVISGTFTSRQPGTEIYTDHWLGKFDVVQIYGEQRVGDWDWYQVGLDEWIEQRNVARVVPDATRPPGVEGDKWISVNLFEQTVSAYENGQLVYATMVSTGRNGFWTQPGTFQVWAKLEQDLMTGGIPGDSSYYYLEGVPWVLYFDESRALHGTYWHAKFGTTTSRGCVNLPMTDAQWFYEFADEGTYVYVYDPSGKTPTDAASYGSGGA